MVLGVPVASGSHRLLPVDSLNLIHSYMGDRFLSSAGTGKNYLDIFETPVRKFQKL